MSEQTSIPFNDLTRHHSGSANVTLPAIARAAASGWYILGTELSHFEELFASYCGVSHAIGVANGTDAIELGLRGMGVEAGDCVATVANAGFYASTSILAIGARPVYVDIDQQSHLMAIDSLEMVLKSCRVKAIIVTHLFGRLVDMAQVSKLAARFGALVLEDCAQAHGAEKNGRKAGSFGDAASFSFYPTKNLGAMGDGGAVTTPHAWVDNRVRLLRQYGWSSKYAVSICGARNSRLDEIQAAVLAAKLPLLDGWNERRRAIAALYNARITHPGVDLPDVSGRDYVGHLYVVRAKARDSLRAHLRSKKISSEIHFPVPDTLQPCWDVDSQWPALPVTESVALQVLSLPCFPELTDQEVEQVAQAVNCW